LNGREQYANIAGAEPAQIILRHAKSSNSQTFLHQSLPLIPNHFAVSVGGPEKAGVGGSIPSLATNIFIALQVIPSQDNHHWSPNGVQTPFGFE
jgi:hypothetical protein